MWTRIRDNFRDVRDFGPSFLSRHTARLFGAKETKVTVAPVGPIHIRFGESDIAVIRQVFRHGDYDLGADHAATRRIEQRYEEILAAGSVPVIVDAGANIGVASLWFRAKYPRAGIVAVEPEPGNGRILHLNLDGRADIKILDAAIGAEPGFVAIENSGQGWAARTKISDEGMPVVTVQQAVATIENGVPFIIKIDIEGFERELFSSNNDWVADAHVVMIEPHDWMLPGEKTSLNFQRAMAQHDFELYLSGENLIYVRV